MPPQDDLFDIATPAGSGVHIDSVNRSLWQYLLTRKRWELILLAALIVVWEVVAIYLFIRYLGTPDDHSNGRGFGYLIIGPIALAFSWYYRLKKQFEDAFLEEFARANGYGFSKFSAVDETYGTIFRLSGRRSVSDIVSGDYDGSGLRLFLYELVTGSGRNQERYRATVLEIDLHGQLPNLLMVNKHSRLGQLPLTNTFGSTNTFSLEGDFNQYFTLYGQPANRIEALEVFTPDTMELMEDQSRHFTVEFSGDRIYIYANGFISTTQDITNAFTLAKKLVAKLAPLANRLENDAAIAPQPANITLTRPGNPLADKLGWVFIAAVGGTGLSLLLIAIVLQTQNHANPQDLPAARPISDQFLNDLQRNDPEAAYNLETPAYQQIRSQQADLADPRKYVPSIPTAPTDQQISWYRGHEEAVFTYSFPDGSRKLDIDIRVQKLGNSWQIDGFKSYHAN